MRGYLLEHLRFVSGYIIEDGSLLLYHPVTSHSPTVMGVSS